MILELDFETRSACDLKKRGAYVYALDPTTDALLASFKFDDGPVQRWRNGEPCPDDIRRHVEAGGEIWAHNAAFERTIWWAIMTPRHGWPKPRLEQFVCTAAMAAAMSLPRALGDLGRALGLDAKKDEEGWRLMLRMSKPRAVKPSGEIVWWEDADRIERLAAYCDADVLAEEAATKRMLPLSAAEREIYLLDQRINDRGIQLDVHAIRQALKIVEQSRRRLDAEMAKVTGWRVPAATNVGALLEWLNEQGVETTTLRRDAIEEILERPDLPAQARRAVEIRQEASKSSTAKLDAFLERASDDGRMRGCYLYHGAGTGRWSSVGAQVQNLPRGNGTVDDPPAAVRYIKQGSAELLEMMYGRPLNVLSDCLRAMLCAKPGHELIAADLANIEGRVNAWCAGERWKLDAFRAYDAGTGPDLYMVAASGIYGLDVARMSKKTHAQERQVGKVAELALGYQGGVNAFHTMAKGYGVEMDPAFAGLWASASEEVRDRAAARYEDCLSRGESATKAMTREGWLASELTKVAWRAKHPAIVQLWRTLEDGCFAAVQDKGSTVLAGPVRYRVAMGFLWCQLPSGRCLAYGAPHIREVETSWGERKPSVTYMGVNSQTKKWERQVLYGGLACENIVQAISRDILAAGMLAVEAAGYPIVMHTHDEIVSEVPRGFGSVEEFEGLMCRLPSWAAGLPVAAEGWRGVRYRK
jgi:DNA polymerase